MLIVIHFEIPFIHFWCLKTLKRKRQYDIFSHFSQMSDIKGGNLAVL